MRIFPLTFALILSASVALAAPPGFTPLKIGDAAPDFKLPGVDGKDHALKDFAEAKLLLVIFTCNHCPTAQAYEERIIKLHDDYQKRGVALVAISPNDDLAVRLDELGYTDVGDGFEDMKLRAKQRGFKFPYLYDGENQKVSLAYGCEATPHCFLFDADRKLRYAGRIDDSEVKTPSSHDLRNALDALLAGKKVPVETTRIFGCSTKWAEKRADAQASLEKWAKEEVKLDLIDEAGVTKLVKNDTDQLLVVNVWATWCGPCVTELPELLTMNRMYRGRKFRLATISLDDPDQKADAHKTLKELQMSTTNYLSSIEKKDTFADLLDKEWKGPLPHTLVIAPGGKVVYRKNGPIEPLELKRAIVGQLGRTYANKK